jgi:hypothetical protein
MCHNEVKDELSYLAGIATSSRNAVCDEPLINQGHTATGGSTANAQPNQQESPKGLHGYLLIQGVWSKQTSSIIDVHVCDTDSNSYLSSIPEKVLGKQELEEKKNMQQCLDSSHRYFTPYYVMLVDRMLATEAKELNK